MQPTALTYGGTKSSVHLKKSKHAVLLHIAQAGGHVTLTLLFIFDLFITYNNRMMLRKYNKVRLERGAVTLRLSAGLVLSCKHPVYLGQVSNVISFNKNLP